MKNMRAKFKKLFEEFVDICNKNGIWYAADGTTLIGVVRHGGFVPWDEKIQVMMTIESYAKLKRIIKGRVIDSSNDSMIENLSGYFLNDSSDFKSEQPFIEIRILVPTTVEKIQKFRSPIYAFRNKVKGRRINTKTSINYLKDNKFEGFLPLEDRKQDIHGTWIQTLSFNTVERYFNGLIVNVPAEYKRILTVWYGEDYMKANIPVKVNKYMSPILTVKEVL